LRPVPRERGAAVVKAVTLFMELTASWWGHGAIMLMVVVVTVVVAVVVVIYLFANRG
jgi:hypothetical protein